LSNYLVYLYIYLTLNNPLKPNAAYFCIQIAFYLQQKLLLITPPFTQLNNPYPATAYLKGFLDTKHIQSFQIDLGIEVTLALFSKQGLTKVFDALHYITIPEDDNIKRIIQLQQHYVNCIDDVILFLQGKNPTLAYFISKRNFLPEASRFNQLNDLHWAFGNMGIQDQAKYIATMFLEDIADLIKTCVDPYFGFSRYAERLGRSANSFDELYGVLQEAPSFVDGFTLDVLGNHIATQQPDIVCLSVPFPGNLYSAFRMGQWLKKNNPTIKILMGGGFANTELRSLSDTRVFEFVDFITLDDGEAPIENIIKHIRQQAPIDTLKRTFTLHNNTVTYINNSACTDYKQAQVGTPNYTDLWLDKYISVIEVANPMHRLWSDGRWNKLTMAHGCYWGKCTFCDVSLDYIARYEPLQAEVICNRMETIIQQTGNNGFHFVDEAAPPALMKAVALEILRRKLVVSWWTNIRFEKSFTLDLCMLLKEAGCIAVSGGLEVASDRLLQLIQKGITVAQVAQVNKNFTEAGIMVHAYLMYGFPTQTAQETVDSLEMVRQMFANNILHSAYWHQFAMTAHSPVGLAPEKFNVVNVNTQTGSFANNDLVHEDPTGTEHELFSFGLKKSLFNYMQGIGVTEPLHNWFEHKTPKTTIDKNYIETICNQPEVNVRKPTQQVVYIGTLPTITAFTQTKKGQSRQMLKLQFETKQQSIQIQLPIEQGNWFMGILQKIQLQHAKPMLLKDIVDDYEKNGLAYFELFWDNKPINKLYKAGLLHI
jgi:hypothetical protein